ncbi:MAG: hypothetical protein ACI4OE_07075 [Alphaproteobacteria bacterium]
MGNFELTLEEAKQRLQQLENGAETQKQPIWQRFDDLVGKMSNDQRAFVDQNAVACAKRQEVMETFANWMFECYKNEFVKVPVFAKLVEGYVDAVAEAAQEFGKKTAGLAKENEELRRQLAELKAQREADTL